MPEDICTSTVCSAGAFGLRGQRSFTHVADRHCSVGLDSQSSSSEICFAYPGQPHRISGDHRDIRPDLAEQCRHREPPAEDEHPPDQRYQ